MSEKTVSAKVTRNFKDSGTEEQFSKDQVIEITEGRFTNYKAAGLVEATTAAGKSAATDKGATKSDA